MEPSTSQFLNDNTDVSTLYEVQRYTVYDLRKILMENWYGKIDEERPNWLFEIGTLVPIRKFHKELDWFSTDFEAFLS